MAFTWVLKKKKSEARSPNADRASEAGVPAICLRVEHGLLMAFGPDGDPVPAAGVDVTLTGGTSDPQRTTTDVNGAFSFQVAKTGSYEVVTDAISQQMRIEYVGDLDISLVGTLNMLMAKTVCQPPCNISLPLDHPVTSPSCHSPKSSCLKQAFSFSTANHHLTATAVCKIFAAPPLPLSQL